MAEAKRIKATVVQPPDMIQLTLTISEAAHVMAVLGNVQCNSIPEIVFWRLNAVLDKEEQFSFDKFYKNSTCKVAIK